MLSRNQQAYRRKPHYRTSKPRWTVFCRRHKRVIGQIRSLVLPYYVHCSLCNGGKKVLRRVCKVKVLEVSSFKGSHFALPTSHVRKFELLRKEGYVVKTEETEK